MGECTVTAYQWAGFYIMTWLGWGELGSNVGSAKIFAVRKCEAEFEIDHPLLCNKYHFDSTVLLFTLYRQNYTCLFLVTLWRVCRSMFHWLLEISLLFSTFLKSGGYCTPELYLDTVLFCIFWIQLIRIWNRHTWNKESKLNQVLCFLWFRIVTPVANMFLIFLTKYNHLHCHPIMITINSLPFIF